MFVLRAFGDADAMQNRVKIALGIALLMAAGLIVIKAALQRRAAAKRTAAGLGEAPAGVPIKVRPASLMLIGAVGGLVVGMTSVGSGSLIIVALMMLYPTLVGKELVGTDLVQAVPLVAAAALGHILFGDFELGLTLSLLVGCLPGRLHRRADVGQGSRRRRAAAAGLRAAGFRPEAREHGHRGAGLDHADRGPGRACRSGASSTPWGGSGSCGSRPAPAGDRR